MSETAALLDLSAQVLNPTPLPGPEGVAVDGAGNIYLSTAGGPKIWLLPAAGEAFAIADLAVFDKAAYGLGVVVDSHGDVYVASPNISGGSVIRIRRPHSGFRPGTLVRPEILRRNAGFANGLALRWRTLYVSDSGGNPPLGIADGRILAFDLDDEGRMHKEVEESEVVATLKFPNGLAVAQGGTDLFVVETRINLVEPGRLVKVRVRDGVITELAKFDGWPDGLCLDAAGDKLHLCLQRAGEVVTVDLDGHVLERRKLTGLDGPLAPASVAQRADGRLVVTDIWTPSDAKILMERLMHWKHVYHHHAYLL